MQTLSVSPSLLFCSGENPMTGKRQITQEKIEISGGLGPIQAVENPIELSIAPVTIFIGPQGTGKSLISQLIYFFRDAEYLLARYSGQGEPDTAVRRVVEGVRAGELTNRALASFLTTNNVRLTYKLAEENKKKLERSITLYRSNRKINPTGQFKKDVDAWLEQWFADPAKAGNVRAQALFIPAERTFFSRFVNADPKMLGGSALPLTMREFARELRETAEIYQSWRDQLKQPSPEAQEIKQLVAESLAGSAQYARKGRYAGKWQWLPAGSSQPLEIEMASSGQMAIWPLVTVAQALFSRQPPLRPQFIHIEEPEAHLHPSAQVAITQALAYLANHGFYIVITTHSLEILYTLNNLTLAFRQLDGQMKERVPPPSVRLSPNELAAYLFAGGAVQPVIDQSGQIDEGLLGETLGDLEVEYNRLKTYKVLWE